LQKRLIYQRFINPNLDSTLVITNVVQKHFGEYYFNFDTTKVRFAEYRELDKINYRRYKEIFLLRNPYTEGLSNTGSLPESIQKAEATGKRVFDESEIRLYKVTF
jgi:hypothetical protein